MGLGFLKSVKYVTGADPSWSYGGFGRFREKIAEDIGIILHEMEGFGGIKPWKDPEDDPIVYLLDHSDCDGILTSYQCEKIAPRLRGILNLWEGTSREKEDAGFDFTMGYRLVEAMEECAEEGADLIFC